MFLLNLSLAEFLAIFGAVSGLLVALYLLDRSRQRQTVASLRFWVRAERPAERRSRRKRIQQPLSLLLQILSIACLLLAVAQLRLGSRENSGRDHVLILDVSAWMDARTAKGRLMDEARTLARRWLAALPPTDRVMVVRADALASPASVFDSSRAAVEEAIAASEPGGTALDIGKALDFARQAQRLHAARAGEIVFIGAGRINGPEAEAGAEVPQNLRVIPVGTAVENCGLRRVGLRRSATDPSAWEVFVSVHNDGIRTRDVDLALQFGGAPAGLRRLNLPPGADESVTFTLRTRAAGWVEARLLTNDALPADNRASLEIPSQRRLRVAVYSEQPGWIRPVLAANPHVVAEFHAPSAYNASAAVDILIFDRFSPPGPPKADGIWIEPPEGTSPVPVRARVSNAPLSRWHSEYSLATGLRTEDLRLQSSEVFTPSPGDLLVAEVAQGPVILARPGTPRIVTLGFHPMRSAMRYELATPLLFANILRWMAPEIFRSWALTAGSVGSVSVPMDPETDLSQVRVVAGDQTPLPFTTQDRNVRFFAGTSGTVRVMAGEREVVYSLTLPEVGGTFWEPPRTARRGVPRRREGGGSARDAWRVLALLGGLGLLADWLVFGSGKTAPPRFVGAVVRAETRRWRGWVTQLRRRAS